MPVQDGQARPGRESPGPARAARHAEPRTAGGSAPVVRRGRPRSEAAERSIIEAVVTLLEEGLPLCELSVDRIARTAGVGKATVYRRWAGKEALFVDVVRSIEPVDPPLPGTSVRDDLVAMVETVRRRGLDKGASALLHNVFAQMQSYPGSGTCTSAPRWHPVAAGWTKCCAGASRWARSVTTSTSICSATCSSARCSYGPCCGPGNAGRGQRGTDGRRGARRGPRARVTRRAEVLPEVCVFCHSAPTWPDTRNPVRHAVVSETVRPPRGGRESTVIA